MLVSVTISYPSGKTLLTSSTISLEATQWSMALWGEDLLINSRGGQIYYWDKSDEESTRAGLVSSESGATGVPTKACVLSSAILW